MLKRAPLSPELVSLREELKNLVPFLEEGSGGYGSVFFERKTTYNYSADLKRTKITDRTSAGVVLRIYDGYSLFEEATDALDQQSLKKSALELIARVKKSQPDSKAEKRPYQPDSWKERLSRNLDPEIRTQIPANVDSKTSVHFGVRYEQDPTTTSNQEHLDFLKKQVERCLTIGEKEGFSKEELSYIDSREHCAVEESIFIDRETNISQTLFREALFITVMCGSERMRFSIGGLGGREILVATDENIQDLLKDLKSLQNAERLQPGRYRILVSPEVAGVVAHEAFGHAQEADTCVRGRSKAWDLHLTGEKAGNDLATILNNPAIYENGPHTYAAWGSYFFDEEGWIAEEQVILNEGKLESPMTNLTSAIRLGVPRSANGKRESWSKGVYTRQTNTYFSAGRDTYDELVARIDHGFIGEMPAGGMEDPKGMGIQVGIRFLREVKGGKPTGRLFKGPNGGSIQLTGYTPEVLSSIIGKSKIEAHSSSPDKSRHPMNDVGGCGKYHKELVLAGCGGTYLLLDQVLLG